jgi:putative pyruvate formate lyase activating enzyme
VEVLELLDGVVDVWMPDLKYATAEVGEALSGVPDYPARARAALTEMHRQVGDAWDVDDDGALQRGLLVRILVLPGELTGVADSLAWIATELSPRVAISLLAQYHPAHRVACLEEHPELQRQITGREWRDAVLALQHHMEGDHHQVQGVRLRR